MSVRFILLTALITATSAPVFACETDSQCLAPATCQFASGQSRGDCRNPPAPNVVAREKNRLVPLAQRKSGDACQFTVDCGYGMSCYKMPGAAEGKCFEPAK